MIKFELIEIFVCCQVYLKVDDVDLVVKLLLEMMGGLLFVGDCIEICGFGSFLLYYCLLCLGCNLKIGELVVLLGKYVFYFKLGKELCEWVSSVLLLDVDLV